MLERFQPTQPILTPQGEDLVEFRNGTDTGITRACNNATISDEVVGLFSARTLQAEEQATTSAQILEILDNNKDKSIFDEKGDLANWLSLLPSNVGRDLCKLFELAYDAAYIENGQLQTLFKVKKPASSLTTYGLFNAAIIRLKQLIILNEEYYTDDLRLIANVLITHQCKVLDKCMAELKKLRKLAESKTSLNRVYSECEVEFRNILQHPEQSHRITDLIKKLEQLNKNATREMQVQTQSLASPRPETKALASHSFQVFAEKTNTRFTRDPGEINYELILKYLQTDCYLNGKKVPKDELLKLNVNNPESFIKLFNKYFPDQEEVLQAQGPDQEEIVTNKVLEHFSQRLIELIPAALKQHKAKTSEQHKRIDQQNKEIEIQNKKIEAQNKEIEAQNARSEQKTALKEKKPKISELEKGIYAEIMPGYLKIDIYTKGGKVYQEIRVNEIRLTGVSTKKGYIKHPAVLRAELTKTGFQISPEESGTDSSIINRLLLGEIVSENGLTSRYGKADKYKEDEVRNERFLRGIMIPAYNEEEKIWLDRFAKAKEDALGRVFNHATVAEAVGSLYTIPNLFPATDPVSRPRELQEFKAEKFRRGWAVEAKDGESREDRFFSTDEADDTMSVRHRAWVKTFINECPTDDNGRLKEWVALRFPFETREALNKYAYMMSQYAFEIVCDDDGNLRSDIEEYIGVQRIQQAITNGQNQCAIRDHAICSALEMLNNIDSFLAGKNSEFRKHHFNMFSQIVTLQMAVIQNMRVALNKLREKAGLDSAEVSPKYKELYDLCEEALVSMLRSPKNLNQIPWLNYLVFKANKCDKQELNSFIKIVKCRIELNKLRAICKTDDTRKIYDEYNRTFSGLCESDSIDQISSLTKSVETDIPKIQERLSSDSPVKTTQDIYDTAVNTCCGSALSALQAAADAPATDQTMSIAAKSAHSDCAELRTSWINSRNYEQMPLLTRAVLDATTVTKQPMNTLARERGAQSADEVPSVGLGKIVCYTLGALCAVGAVVCLAVSPFTSGISFLPALKLSYLAYGLFGGSAVLGILGSCNTGAANKLSEVASSASKVKVVVSAVAEEIEDAAKVEAEVRATATEQPTPVAKSEHGVRFGEDQIKVFDEADSEEDTSAQADTVRVRVEGDKRTPQAADKALGAVNQTQTQIKAKLKAAQEKAPQQAKAAVPQPDAQTFVSSAQAEAEAPAVQKRQKTERRVSVVRVSAPVNFPVARPHAEQCPGSPVISPPDSPGSDVDGEPSSVSSTESSEGSPRSPKANGVAIVGHFSNVKNKIAVKKGGVVISSVGKSGAPLPDMSRETEELEPGSAPPTAVSPLKVTS